MVEPPFFYGCPLNLKRDTDMVRNVRKHGVADSFFFEQQHPLSKREVFEPSVRCMM